MAARSKPKVAPTDHRIMVRLSAKQYENLAQVAEANAVPLAVFCRSVLVRAMKENRLRGITSKRSPAAKGVAA